MKQIIQFMFAFCKMNRFTLHILILIVLPCIFSQSFPKAYHIEYSNFTSFIFTLSEDEKQCVFLSYSNYFSDIITVNITLKFYDTDRFPFTFLGSHIYQLKQIFTPSEIYWIGPKVIVIARNNQFIVLDVLTDGSISQVIAKKYSSFGWQSGSIKRVGQKDNLMMFALKLGNPNITKTYKMALLGQQIVIVHECGLSKPYSLSNVFYSVFMLMDYYCFAVAPKGANRLTIECCSSQTNSSINTTFVLLVPFKSQFRISPIPQTYQAYVIYQKASIHKIEFDHLNQTFTLKSLSWNITKSVEGAICLNDSLITIQKDKQNNQYIVSFYLEDNNKIQGYQRLRSSIYEIQSDNDQFIDSILFKVLPNYRALLFSKLQISNSLDFFMKFVQQQQQNYAGIISVIVLLLLLLLSSLSYCIKNLSLTRIKVMSSLQLSQIIIQIFCYTISLALILLKVIGTNTNVAYYNDQSTLGAQNLIGSYWLRLFQKHYLLVLVVITINQLKSQHQYKQLYIENHIRHGFNVHSFISFTLLKLILKSLFITAISFSLLLVIQQNYNSLPIRTFQWNSNLFCSIVVCTATLVSFALLSKIINQIVNVYWKTLSIIYLLLFSLNNYCDLFYRNNEINSFDYFLTIFWAPSLLRSYLQLIYQAQLRFLSNRITQTQIEIAIFFHLIVLSIVYILQIKRIERRSNIDGMVDKKSKRQFDLNINYSGSEQSSFSAKIQAQREDSLLNVYVPIKINLKNRQQKNKVLEDIHFYGKRGQVLSFIDDKNQSKTALFKILTGEEKSHQVIQLGLVGKVSYSERVKVSFCLDYDLSFPDLTVIEHLQFYCWLKKPSSSKQQIKAQIQHILDEFEIADEYRSKKSKELSGGYLKKMCLACAFVGNPDVIILDEPTLGLDIKFQKYFQHKMKAWKENKLIIIFTANHNEAIALSDKIWYFRNQTLQQEQTRKKYLKIQIKLQILTQDAFTTLSPIIQQFIEATFAKSSKATISGIHKWFITIDKPYKDGIDTRIRQFITFITDMNSPTYICHFDYRMIQTALTQIELLDKYSNESSFCKNCDGRHLYEHLKAEMKADNQFEGLSLGEDNRTRYLNKAQKILNLLSDEVRKSSIWASQIQSIIYRRRKLMKYLTNQKGSIFFAQTSLWINWLFISSQQDPLIKCNIIFSFVLYLILQMETAQFYVGQKRFGHYDYYKSVGLDWMYYWVGNILFDFFSLLIPLFAAIFLAYNLQNFDIISYFQPSVDKAIISCILIALCYSLFQIFMALFISNMASKYSLLFTILLFPLLLEFDPYLVNYDSDELCYRYLSFFLFPWSLKKIIQGNQGNIYYLLVATQIILMAVLILITQQHREKHKQKEGRFYLQDFIYSSNEQTLDARRQIEQIENKKLYVFGEDIIKCYGEKASLRNVSFHVKKGEILGVFGHNGSGKTTLFKIIVKRLSQSSGLMHYFGKRRKNMNLMDNLQISYCPQFDHFDPNLSLQQNLIAIGKIKGLQSKYLSKFIAVFLDYMDLKGNQQVPARDLSVGERKKAYFAAALLGLPNIIVCDQISTGLNAQSIQNIMALLRVYSSSNKKCVIITSHNLHEGQQFCDRIMLLKNGTIKASNSAFRLRMDASQQLYKIIITFKRQDNPALRNHSKQRIVSLFNEIEFKKNVFEDEYSMVYSVDMKERIGFIFAEIYSIYLQGIITKFSFYKHDLEEFAKTYMNQKQEESIQ